MFFVAAVFVSGMAPAAPVALGSALCITALISPLMGVDTSMVFRLIGAAGYLVAVIAGIMASRRWSMARLVEAMQSGKTKSTKKAVSSKTAILSLLAGLFIAISKPLMEMGRGTEINLGPYSYTVLFAIGALLSTFLFQLFFMNLPVQGKPADLGAYFRGKLPSHMPGIFGGMMASIGLLCSLLSLRADGAAVLDSKLAYALANGSVLLIVLWGLIYWKELQDTDAKVTGTVAVTVIFLAIGLGCVSLAQLPAAH
jgi:glucose uptake protein